MGGVWVCMCKILCALKGCLKDEALWLQSPTQVLSDGKAHPRLNIVFLASLAARVRLCNPLLTWGP